MTRVLINSRFGVSYSNFSFLTPTFWKVSIEKYGKTPTFSGQRHFTPIFKILVRTLHDLTTTWWPSLTVHCWICPHLQNLIMTDNICVSAIKDPITLCKLLTNSTDNKSIFYFLQKKQELTFHANCLLRRQFAWNVKFCSFFSGKRKKIFQDVSWNF